MCGLFPAGSSLKKEHSFIYLLFSFHPDLINLPGSNLLGGNHLDSACLTLYPPQQRVDFGSKVCLSIIQTVLWMDLRKDFGGEDQPQSWDFADAVVLGLRCRLGLFCMSRQGPESCSLIKGHQMPSVESCLGVSFPAR